MFTILIKKEFLKQLFAQLKRKEIAAIPELLAFNFIMAIIPLLIVFFQILAFLSINTTMLNETIANYLPEELYQFFLNFIENETIQLSRHPLFLIISIGTLILTISKGVNGIFKAFAITDIDHHNEPMYKRRLAAILTFFSLLAFVSFGVLIITSSHHFLANFPPFIRSFIELCIFTLVCFGFFFLLFMLTSCKKQNCRKILPGTFVSATGFIITSIVFSYYVDRLANFNLIYGSLAAIIVLLFWLYLFGFVINIGIQINFVMGKMIRR